MLSHTRSMGLARFDHFLVIALGMRGTPEPQWGWEVGLTISQITDAQGIY